MSSKQTPQKNIKKVLKEEISNTSIWVNNILLLLSAILHSSIVIGVLYALFVPTLNNDPAQRFSDGREFKTNAAVPLGNDHRNEFGDYYGMLLAVHAILGWISFVFILIAASPNWMMAKDNKTHTIIGIITILILVMVICAAVPMEILLITSRGYLQCQWTDYSFSVYISIHFTQWFIWIMELLNYGITSIIYKNNYKLIPKYNKYFLIYLSIITIIFNIWKCCMWFVIYSNENTINCTPTWRIWMNFGVNLVEIPTIKYSINNIKNIQQLTVSKISNTKPSKSDNNDDDTKWKSMHGKNLRILTLLVIATIVANIVYKLGDNICGILYLLVFLISIPTLYFIEMYFDFIPDQHKKQN